MPDDATRAPQQASPLSARAALEQRYNGPIPARECDAARYPTLERQIARTRRRIAAARGAAARRMAEWQREMAYARERSSDEASLCAAAAAARRVHIPHLRYFIREARNWTAHLAELETQARSRSLARTAPAAERDQCTTIATPDRDGPTAPAGPHGSPVTGPR